MVRHGCTPAAAGPRLAIFRPGPAAVANSTTWLINGFPAILTIWTAEEWARLEARPPGAQQNPDGRWVHLRIE